MPASPSELGDLAIRTLALATLFAGFFLLPGRTLAERLLPDRPVAERNAFAWAVGPLLVALLTWGLGRLGGWTPNLLLVGTVGLLLAAATPAELRKVGAAARATRARLYRAIGARDRGGSGPVPPSEDGFPALVAAALGLFFALRFVPAGDAAVPIALPRGLAAPFAVFAGALDTPGLRVWFASTFLALALVFRALLLRLGLAPRWASAAAALAALNPLTLPLRGIEDLRDVSTALGFLLLLLLADDARRGRRRPAALLLAAGLLLAVRPAALLALPLVALFAARKQLRPPAGRPGDGPAARL